MKFKSNHRYEIISTDENEITMICEALAFYHNVLTEENPNFKNNNIIDKKVTTIETILECLGFYQCEE